MVTTIFLWPSSNLRVTYSYDLIPILKFITLKEKIATNASLGQMGIKFQSINGKSKLGNERLKFNYLFEPWSLRLQGIDYIWGP